ncbi:MAG: VOC family protein [Rhizobiaceae bacterium]
MTEPRRSLATVAIVVRDYDEARDWYVSKLGFVVCDDVDLGGGRRWLVVAPPGGRGARLLLANAEGEAQLARVGDQTGGRVFLFLDTDDFARDHAAMLGRGVVFREAPRREGYGTVAVFEDLYGNRFDLIQPAR